jgi:hypothetical protein
MIPVGWEVADALPPGFAAVTWKRSLDPTSAIETRYVGVVAPGSCVQDVAAALQRCQA